MRSQRLHDRDIHAWANRQTSPPRAGRWPKADIEPIADEIDSTGQGEIREPVKRSTPVPMHAPQRRLQPALPGTGRRPTLQGPRNRLADHPADRQSLKSVLADAVVAAYRHATLAAARDTGLDRGAFPVARPWRFEPIIDPASYPDAAH